MKIEMISDVICPWCFLGKRRLDKALTLVPEIQVEVIYRPFFLDPSIPPEGLNRADYMKAKFGDRDLSAMHKPLAEAGKKDGVPYQFEKITRTPNTMDAHRLICWAKEAKPNVQGAMKEALLCAYWRDGKDIGDHKVLAEIATSVGMDGGEVAVLLTQDTDKAAVMKEVEHAYKLGVSGVPTFVFDRHSGISGAQEAESLAQIIRDVAAKH